MDAVTRHWRETFDPVRLACGRQCQAQMAPSTPCHHCWHPSVGAWAGSPPPPVHCCWCGLETCARSATAQRHGPYLEVPRG